MLHIWLIPAVVVLVLLLFALYLTVRHSGGAGVRTDGTTLLDKPSEEHDLPPQ